MPDEKLADLLIVDEDERTRGPEERWMRGEGYDGHCLPSGVAALDFLASYRPRYAVLDLTTLGGEGIDFLAALRLHPRLRDLALVVHVAVPESAAEDSCGFRSLPFLTRGIEWPAMRAEAERYRQ